MTAMLQDSSPHHTDRVRMSGETLGEGGRVHGERSERERGGQTRCLLLDRQRASRNYMVTVNPRFCRMVRIAFISGRLYTRLIAAVTRAFAA
jgi:hypothetical protein